MLAEELKKADRVAEVHKEKPATFVATKQKPRKFSAIDVTEKDIWPRIAE